MITKNTLFILGAGASVPYGYPTGAGLRSYICGSFQNAYRRLFLPKKPGADQETKDETEKAQEFVDVFFKSSTPSIDLFMARNRKFSEMGKKAIVVAMMEHEKESRFREKAHYPEQDWYTHLYEKMTEGMITPDSLPEFKKNKVNFITFNYDRSLEQFFYESLRNSFSASPEEEIIKAFGSMTIAHVYGKLGALDWESRKGTKYRSGCNLGLLKRAYQNIRTIYEVGPNDCAEMKELIAQASRVFFLGFGYAKENLDAIGVAELLAGNRNIFGTAFNRLPEEIMRIKNALKRRSKRPHYGFVDPKIENCDSLSLLRSTALV
jgi:hypothetical protein